MRLGSVDNPIRGRRVKADKTVGPIQKGEIYKLKEIKGNRYVIDVNGVTLSYPLNYFFYI